VLDRNGRVAQGLRGAGGVGVSTEHASRPTRVTENTVSESEQGCGVGGAPGRRAAAGGKRAGHMRGRVTHAHPVISGCRPWSLASVLRGPMGRCAPPPFPPVWESTENAQVPPKGLRAPFQGVCPGLRRRTRAKENRPPVLFGCQCVTVCISASRTRVSWSNVEI
jgi:hypothetical protein